MSVSTKRSARFRCDEPRVVYATPLRAHDRLLRSGGITAALSRTNRLQRLYASPPRSIAPASFRTTTGTSCASLNPSFRMFIAMPCACSMDTRVPSLFVLSGMTSLGRTLRGLAGSDQRLMRSFRRETTAPTSSSPICCVVRNESAALFHRRPE